MTKSQVRFMGIAAFAFAVGWAGTTAAALTPAQKCEKLKNKAAGKRALCVAKERGKEIAGKPFNYATCTTKMADAFTRAETNAGGLCPTTGDAAATEARIDGIFDPSHSIPKALSGVRFVDNGDGTVSDTQTGLQWEQKDGLDFGTNFTNPHDADNTYTWNTTFGGAKPNGTAFTDFLDMLNNCTYDGNFYVGGFAGHCNWRLPTEEELMSIVDLTVAGCGTGSPCISSTFGPTQPDFYWSSTTDASGSDIAWGAFLLLGIEAYGGKGGAYFVRAVRGGF